MPFDKLSRIIERAFITLLLLTTITAWGQALTLPSDFRQHNLSQFNASLVNPTFSYDWDRPRSITAWARYQWQSIDLDPTTATIGYSQRFGDKVSGGIGAFRNNTGIFLQQGGYINAVYAFNLGENSKIFLGANAFVYDKSLPDEFLVTVPPASLPALEETTGLVFSLQTGLRVQVYDFNLAFGVENTYDYNFSTDLRETTNEQRVFNGLISYDFPLSVGRDSNGTLRPIFYGESSGEDEFRYGGLLLFTSDKFWVQGGYSDFYGASGGAGVTLFDKLSIGGLIEIGIEEPTDEVDPTFELITSYNLGAQSVREKKEKKNEELDQAIEEERRRALEEERRRRAIAEQDSIYQARLAEKRRLDSIARVEEERNRLENLNAPDKNERIEHVTNADGLQSGYYLIANVFGTEKYFNQFMDRLRREGLEPKYFYRGLNGYNYVYLNRFNTLGEAREARDSNFFGRYFGETWIFHVE